MEKLIQLQKAILSVIHAYQASYPLPKPELHYETIADKEAHHYQLIRLGWVGRKRVHVLVFHLDIVEGKIWIQQDQTEIGVANLLLEAGVDKNDIVLAYFSPSHRKHTGFAIA
jgi:hypothetical protein